MKKCTKCEESKEFSKFSKTKKGKDGLRSWCKDCRKEATAKYRKENSEKCRESLAKYRIEHTEYFIKYRKENSERIKRYNAKYRTENSESIRKYDAKYKKNNPSKINASTARRRSLKLQRTPKWLTKSDYDAIREFYISAKELEKIFGIKYHVDHIIPLKGKSVSGLHVAWNLLLLTATENLKKHCKF
jgi:hypothetical protein